MDAIKGAGIFVISSATMVAEAKILERRGVDAVIAQGTEAGGHRGTFTGVDMGMQPGLFALLPQVVDTVRVPVAQLSLTAPLGATGDRELTALFAGQSPALREIRLPQSWSIHSPRRRPGAFAL